MGKEQQMLMGSGGEVHLWTAGDHQTSRKRDVRVVSCSGSEFWSGSVKGEVRQAKGAEGAGQWSSVHYAMFLKQSPFCVHKSTEIKGTMGKGCHIVLPQKLSPIKKKTY